MWKHVASNALTLAIFVLICVIGLISWGQREFVKDGPLDQTLFFEVPRGATLTRVSNSLEAEGAISSAQIFRIAAQYSGKAEDLKFNNYELPAGASMEQILDIVTQASAPTFRYVAQYTISEGRGVMRLRERQDGSLVEIASFSYTDGLPEAYADLVNRNVPINYRITVAEGVTSWNIIEALKGADFLSGEAPEELPAEGTLAPDTYEVAKGTSRADVIRRMEAAQEAILAEAWELRADDLPISSQDEALILASIIEKETSVPDERGLVAGVFTNRLRRGIRLQTDPTVIYGITQGQGTLGRGLRRSELRRETPWNTYTIDGLPPTPIANPGRAAIEAALNPEATDYIFFVADGTGGHAFAATLPEHNANVARWRQIEAERANQ
ncbi:MAG: endolytic transglycosylase MltG [Dinoroseobacter sp.]|nr:endolytic transglycosylase MltG [Dinoroseobacter sp.]